MSGQQSGSFTMASLSQYVAPLAQANCVSVLDVSNADTGAILGRRGKNIAEITQISGARVKVSDRDDTTSESAGRKVTISGTLDSVHLALLLVCQKVGMSESPGPSSGGRMNGGY